MTMEGFYDYEPDAVYLLQRVDVAGRAGVIVDFSNSHGLCFGVIFPNRDGSSARTETMKVKWFDPDEVEILD